MLNEEKTRLVLENINLVYKWCNKNDMCDEDTIQHMTLKFIEKLDNYNEDRGTLSTFIWRCLDNERLQIIRRRNANKRKAEMFNISLSTTLSNQDEGEKLCLQDTIADEYSNIQQFEDIDLIKSTIRWCENNLSELEMNVFMRYLSGCKQGTIAETVGISQSYTSRIIKLTQKRLRKEFERR